MRQLRRGQGAGGNNDIGPVRWRQANHFFAHNRDQGVGFKPGGNLGRKPLAIHRQSAARRDLMHIAAGQDDRAAAPHFGMQKANRIMLPIIRAKRVGTDKLSQALALMRLSAAMGAHFVQYDGHAHLRRLPGRFRTGQAAANNV